LRPLYDSGACIYGFDGQSFHLQEDADGDLWQPDWPVLMVTWSGASAFAAHEARQTAEGWQLLPELIWEKAVRGVDGRTYPWGDEFDAARANMCRSRNGAPFPASVHSFPHDESVYGVRGTAGNVRECCVDMASESGPVLDDARVVALDPTVGGEAQHTRRVSRGGAWTDSPVRLRLTRRDMPSVHDRYHGLGFRIGRPFRE
jgi:serine/threonine-protein kinase